MVPDSVGVTDRSPNAPPERATSAPPLGDALLLAHLPCGVIAVDSGGYGTHVNLNAASLWPALSAVTGPQPLAPPAEGWRISVESLLASALRGEDPPAVEILAGAHGTAEALLVRVVVTPLRDGDGCIAGAVAVCIAIPEAKQTAGLPVRQVEAQGQANRELVRSNTELLQFASVASHDLQEPLRKILAFGDRLRRSDGTALSERGHDSLARMLVAADRMQTLINDLLAFARVTTAAHPFVPVDLAATASGVLGDLENQIARCGGRVLVGTLPTVEADALQMRQLLQNLISNALKFRQSDRPPEVTITAEIVDAPASAAPGSAPWHRLIVRDNGIGFDQQYAERIFRVFERLHGRTEYEGTGIGLALCRQIVERHGGGIRAVGQPGTGATFLVTLPAHQAKEAAE